MAILDDTEDARRERALENAIEAAKSANQAKSAFLSNMSHDIRTPMNAIMGFATLAQTAFDKPEKQKRYLEKILSSGNHLLNLINDILDMSHIESGRLHLEETKVDLTETLDEIEDIVSMQVMEKEQTLSVDISGVENKKVLCDKTRLCQVLLNLLSNAIKFTPSGGIISVTIMQKYTTSGGMGMYEIRVKDNGIGMDAEFTKKLFEPFYQERTSTISRVQGTGLGLAITKNIIDMMGGSIEVFTEKGKGTEFVIYLMLRIQNEREEDERQEEETRPEEPEILHPLKGKRILVAEDNETNMEITTEIIMEYGGLVDKAENGAIAVKKVKKSAPGYYSLILMDIRMPVMDGNEAAKKIRNLPDPELASIPIIAMTANAFDEDRRKAQECGMDGFLSKPIHIETAINLIHRFLR